ncbi:MAG: prolyl oligopeptidase family serine peptidase [Tepidisphaeraceae bacterium]
MLIRLLSIVCGFCVFVGCALADAPATRTRWPSTALTGAVNVTVHAAPGTMPAAGWPTVVYLKGLAAPRVGRTGDDEIITNLQRDGLLVLEIDYAGDAKAVGPNLAIDVLKLRKDLTDAKSRGLLPETKVDANHLFFVPAGRTLRRNIEFARDGDRVLGMDIIVPVDPAKPVPVLVEFTCDNVNRMGSGSLLFCRDTLLEVGAMDGFAVAMADHPVAPPYKGIDDPMPQVLEWAQAAVAKLRSMNDELKLTGKVGAIGFSRGGPFAAMLAARGDVDAALVHGNRYDYTTLADSDPMLARFTKAWGSIDDSRDRWKQHGAIAHMTDKCAPMFLNTSDAESEEYRDGLIKLESALSDNGVEHVYQVDSDGRGHKVSTDPKTLRTMTDFFHKHLEK